MANVPVLLLLVMVLVSAEVGTRLVGGLRPAAAARTTAMMLCVAVVAGVSTFWLLGLSGLAHLGLENPLSDWSRHLLPELAPVGAAVGVAMLALGVVGGVRAVGVLVVHRRLRCCDTPALEFVDSDDVFAHTLPGPAGTVAVSTGLRRLVDAGELEIVIAHERAHARHRHDRLLLLGLLGKALVPFVGSIVSRLEFRIERWADEDAVETVGADRRIAARTLAKVALHASGQRALLGIARHGVAARAEALAAPAMKSALSSLVAAIVAVSSTLVLVFWQLHQMAVFVDGLHH